MARSISEIKRSMTDAFMADPTIREMYGLSGDDTFSARFSSVSIESILFFIVAACCHVLESLFEAHRADVDDKISRAIVASVPWYYKKALLFQYGDALTFDEPTHEYRYPSIDESKQRVKYAAVRDRGTAVEVLVAGEKDGLPEPLSNDVLTSFKQYMNRIKIAGVILNIHSRAADKVVVNAKITVDPLIIDITGTRISDGTKPVEDAIKDYLKNIVYGGTFNKTRLVDAIQRVPGVLDIELGTCRYRTGSAELRDIQGNNYTALGGCFVAEGLSNTLLYVVQS